MFGRSKWVSSITLPLDHPKLSLMTDYISWPTIDPTSMDVLFLLSKQQSRLQSFVARLLTQPVIGNN